jgi:hypothetical protein
MMSLTNQSKKKKKRPKSNNETLKFEKRAKTFDSHIWSPTFKSCSFFRSWKLAA